MNFKLTLIASLVSTLLLGAPLAHAAAPAGQVTQLSGFVMAVKPGGGLKVLSSQSALEVGDTLMSEQNTFVRVDLPDGRQAVLGPQTRLHLTDANTLELREGQLRVTASSKPNAAPLTITAGGNTVNAGNGSFDLHFVPEPAEAAVALSGPAAMRARLGTLGAAATPTTPGPSAIQLAQNVIPIGAIKPPGTQPLPAGLYVSVVEGAINLSNKGGSQSFTAGQFGYTANVTKPPVVVPANPGIKFTPPPTFASNSGQGSGSGNKAGAVDCVVR